MTNRMCWWSLPRHSVTAYFIHAQRQSAKDVGAITDLLVFLILHEPTAAAIAYGLEKNNDKHIIVYDLSGGTFDDFLLTIDNGAFEVGATDDDAHIGEEDCDQRAMAHFMTIPHWAQEGSPLDIGTPRRSSAAGCWRRVCPGGGAFRHEQTS